NAARRNIAGDRRTEAWSWPAPVRGEIGRRPSFGGGAGIGGPLGPPERLFGFADKVAPRRADVVQVAVGPLSQFLTRAVTLPPGVESLGESGPNARNMMICHRFMGQDGHFQLLKLISRRNICSPQRFRKRHVVPLQMR